MSKTNKNLLIKIIDIENLRDAYNKTVIGGNRYTIGHLNFKEHLEANLLLIQKQILNNTYKIGIYKEFKVFEPKERLIRALPFRDRVLQHAIFNIIEPIFENTFYSCSYACRKNKGTHKGVKDVQATIRRLAKKGKVYYLQMDFSKYFKSININILFKEIGKKISDWTLINILRQFVDSGIPIGNLLSQLFANIYGHIFDRFIKTKLKAKHYFRYMDDTVIITNSKKELVRYQKILKKFSGIFMRLKFSRWHINSMDRPLNFLGYRISTNYKLIRKDSVNRAKKKIRRYMKFNLIDKLDMFLASWLGHIKYADTYNLQRYVLNLQKEIRNGTN